jgi:hypothetical protein
MVQALIIMHHIALFIPCITLLLVSHTYVFCDRPHGAGTRGADGANSVEDFTSLDLNQVKPQCIPPKSLSFVFELYL